MPVMRSGMIYVLAIWPNSDSITHETTPPCALLGLHEGVGMEATMPGVARASTYTIAGVDLSGSGERLFKVDLAIVDAWRDRGVEAKYWDSVLVSEVVKSPTSTFRGLKRRNASNAGECYCGKPKERFLDGTPAKPPIGEVFVAYVFGTPDGDSRIVDWDWWPEDPDLPGHPKGWQDDYQERVCPTI